MKKVIFLLLASVASQLVAVGKEDPHACYRRQSSQHKQMHYKNIQSLTAAASRIQKNFIACEQNQLTRAQSGPARMETKK